MRLAGTLSKSGVGTGTKFFLQCWRRMRMPRCEGGRERLARHGGFNPDLDL